MMHKLLTAARILLGLWLALLALLLLLYPPAMAGYARTGLPDWSRILLAGMESVGGVLFALRRTAVVGGALLFGSLMMAVGLHIGLHRGFTNLLLFGAAVLALLWATTRKPSAA